MHPMFINLTDLDGAPITINVSKIVCFETRFTSSKRNPDTHVPYTYIVLSAGNTVTRSVRESYEEFVEIMRNFYINNKTTTTQND